MKNLIAVIFAVVSMFVLIFFWNSQHRITDTAPDPYEEGDRRTPDAVNIDRLAAGVLAETYAELRTFSATAYPEWVTDGMIAYVRSRATDGDGGDGYFRYVVGDTSSDNGGTILEAGSDAWNRIYTGSAKVAWWTSSKDDSSIDDSIGIDLAIAYLASYVDACKPTLEFDSGVYYLNSQINVIQDYVVFKGQGRGHIGQGQNNSMAGTTLRYVGTTLTGTDAVMMIGDEDTADYGRGFIMDGFTIQTRRTGMGMNLYGFNRGVIRNVMIDSPTTGVYMHTKGYSSLFEMVEIYDATTGGFDLRDNCHNTTLFKCKVSSGITQTPSYGARFGTTQEFAGASVVECDFQQAVVGAHIIIDGALTNFNFTGNYIESRDDATAAVMQINAGTGINISGNYFETFGSVIDYAIEIASGVDGVYISGNHAEGFQSGFIDQQAGAYNIVAIGNYSDQLPIVNNGNALGDKKEMSVNQGQMVIDEIATETFTLTQGNEVTISDGEITVTDSHHTVDTEGDAASDDLDTINGGGSKDWLIIRPAAGARTVTVKNQTGNIKCGSDFVMDEGEDNILLFKVGSYWHTLGGKQKPEDDNERLGISSDSDGFDVSGGVKIIRADTSSSDVTLGALDGGQLNQRIYIYKSSSSHDLIIEHNEGTGNEDFALTGKADINLPEYGGLIVIFDGTYWRELSARGTATVHTSSQDFTSATVDFDGTTMDFGTGATITGDVDTTGEIGGRAINGTIAAEGSLTAAQMHQAVYTISGAYDQTFPDCGTATDGCSAMFILETDDEIEFIPATETDVMLHYGDVTCTAGYGITTEAAGVGEVYTAVCYGSKGNGTWVWVTASDMAEGADAFP
jgi:hypothetical protein